MVNHEGNLVLFKKFIILRFKLRFNFYIAIISILSRGNGQNGLSPIIENYFIETCRMVISFHLQA